MPRHNEGNNPPDESKDKVLGDLAPETARLDTTVALESEPFVAFEQWMDQELDKLVARWLPFAAPNASLRSNSFSRERM